MGRRRALVGLFDELVQALLAEGEPRNLLRLACERLAVFGEYPLVGLCSFAQAGPFAVVGGLAAGAVERPAEPTLTASALARFGIEAALALPVRRQGNLAAVLHLFSRSPFEPAELASLQAFADRLALVVSIAGEQQQMRLLGAALASAANAIFITRRDGTILWANDAFARMSGYPLAEAVGANPRILRSDAHDDAFFREVWQTINAGRPWHGEVVERHRSGRHYVVLQTITPIFDAGGTLTHFVAMHEEVTERKRLEEALRTARDKALEAARLRSAFLANMSHEVRTPMNGVLGMLELLAGTPLTPEQRHYLEVARRSARTLLDSLNEILDYSQLEAVGVQLMPEVVEPAALLDEVLELMAGSAGEKGVELYYRIDPATPARVRLDPVRVRQILLNLTGNAIKFTERGEVTVTLAPDLPGLLRFDVRDTGIGIPEAVQATIFEPFAQGDISTTRRFGGSGLGLAICRQLAEQMGGRIGVQSRPGHGSRFWFTLRGEPVEVPHDGAEPLAGRRALLLEPRAGLREALAELCRSLGLEVTPAGSGAEALLLMEAAGAAAAGFDLLLLPELLPDLPLAALGGWPGAPAVIVPMAAPGGQPAIEQAHCLRRPVSRGQLRDVISAALARRLEPPAAAEPPRRTRVLVAEDNPINQQVAAAMLARLEVPFELVGDGRAALARAAQGGLDLILMDCQMPEMDGFEAAGRIRRLERERLLPRVPIVAVTAHARPDEAERCAAVEMDGYLGKPLTLSALRQLLERWAPAPQAAPAEPPAGPLLPHAVRQLTELEAEDAVGIIDAWLRDTPRRLAEIGTLLAQGEGGAPLARALHTLRGSSASLGAGELVKICAEWEAALHAGEGYRPEGLALLEAALNAARPALAALRRELGGSDDRCASSR